MRENKNAIGDEGHNKVDHRQKRFIASETLKK
jgi:hypothetical protein